MKREIIQAVYEKFSEKGYSATLSEIANTLGLKKQSLYNYFDSKEELFLEMIQVKLREHYSEQIILLSANKSLDTETQLKNIFMSFIKSFQDIEKLKFWKRLLLIENPSLLKQTKEAIKENENSFSKKLGEIILGILKTRPELEKYHTPIWLSYVSFIHGLLEGYLLYGEEDYFEKYIEDVWDFFARGLKCYLNEGTNNEE